MTTVRLTRTDVERTVHEVVIGILPATAAAGVAGDKHLKELGADSVERVEIVLGILERMGLTEPMSSFSELPSVDALVDFVLELSS